MPTPAKTLLGQQLSMTWGCVGFPCSLTQTDSSSWEVALFWFFKGFIAFCVCIFLSWDIFYCTSICNFHFCYLAKVLACLVFFQNQNTTFAMQPSQALLVLRSKGRLHVTEPGPGFAIFRLLTAHNFSKLKSSLLQHSFVLSLPT